MNISELDKMKPVNGSENPKNTSQIEQISENMAIRESHSDQSKFMASNQLRDQQ